MFFILYVLNFFLIFIIEEETTMNKKYKIISLDLQKNLIDFLDEVQFEAAKNNTTEDMHVVNFCSWAIKELSDSLDGYLKDKPTNRNPQKKSIHC